MKRPLPLALLLGLSLGASATFAQSANTSIIDRAQQPAPPPAPSGGQTATTRALGPEGEDIGIQRVAEPRKFPVKLFLDADAQVYYTDNVLLQAASNPQSNSDAVVFATTLSVRAETPSKPFANGLITPSIGLVYQRYYHGIASDDPARDDLDFDSYSIPLTLSFRNQNGWNASLSVTAGSIYRLNDTSKYKNIYRNLTPSASVRKTIGVSQTQLITLGTTLAYSKTWTDTPGVIGFDFREDRNDKVDLSGDIAYYYIRGKWVLNAYGRASAADYLHYQEAGNRDVNRRDTTLGLGASATYNLTPWASARIFTSSDWRLSNQDGGTSPDNYTYQASNLGVGLSVSASF